MIDQELPGFPSKEMAEMVLRALANAYSTGVDAANDYS
jgi:hypothetical protein